MRILITSIALASIALHPLAAEVPRVLLKTGDIVSGSAGTYTVVNTRHPFAHRAGGRGSLMTLQDSTGATVFGFWGSRAGEQDSLLRAPMSIAGRTQQFLFADDSDAMAESGVLTYWAGIDDNQGGYLDSVWVGDTFLFAVGDAVPSAPGMVWSSIRRVKPSGTGGDMIMDASIEPVAGGPASHGLWVGTSPPVRVLESGLQLPGFTLPIADTRFVNWGANSRRVGVSRSGNHRLVVIDLNPGGPGSEPDGVTLDEAPLFVDGFVLQEGQPTPPSVAALGTWLSFDSAWVDDAGSWQLLAVIDDGMGGGGGILLQDGVVILRAGDPAPGGGTYQQFYGFHANDDGDRALMAKIGGVPRIVLNDELVFTHGDTVDFDGDGVADPGHDALIGGSTERFAFDEDGTLLFAADVFTPTGGVNVLLELRGYGLGTGTCGPAAVNSTGLPGEIAAGGSAVAGGRPLRLRATDLPSNQFGYFLASRTAGFVANPGGSQGNLCLGGSIGRFVGQVANSGAAGRLEIDVDTTAIPVSPAAPILSGQTWIFQAWFRDANPAPTSNFTDAIEITFE